jgi:hypothetical protein
VLIATCQYQCMRFKMICQQGFDQRERLPCGVSKCCVVIPEYLVGQVVPRREGPSSVCRACGFTMTGGSSNVILAIILDDRLYKTMSGCLPKKKLVCSCNIFLQSAGSISSHHWCCILVSIICSEFCVIVIIDKSGFGVTHLSMSIGSGQTS